MAERCKVCDRCEKKKSLSKFDLDKAICRRCVESMPIDREITMKDLLVVLDKINTTIAQMLVAKTA